MTPAALAHRIRTSSPSTLSAIAQVTGVPQAAMTNYAENGTSHLDPAIADKLAEIFAQEHVYLDGKWRFLEKPAPAVKQMVRYQTESLVRSDAVEYEAGQHNRPSPKLAPKPTKKKTVAEKVASAVGADWRNRPGRG